MKIRNLVVGTMVSAMLFTLPVCAEDKPIIDYGTCFDVGNAVHIDQWEDLDLTIKLLDENYEKVFYMGMVADYVYINEDLGLYAVPNTNTKIHHTVHEGDKIFRAAWNIYGWNIVQVDGINYFLYVDDLKQLEKVDGVEYTELKEFPQPTYTSSYSGGGYYSGGGGGYSAGYSTGSMSEDAAKEWIAMRESGGSYSAVSPNGKYIGRYQLTASYLGGDYSVENQERVAEQYVKDRYGSWSNAQAYWQSHGWY